MKRDDLPKLLTVWVVVASLLSTEAVACSPCALFPNAERAEPDLVIQFWASKEVVPRGGAPPCIGRCRVRKGTLCS